jgi:DNA-binding response OmpR family regulator
MISYGILNQYRVDLSVDLNEADTMSENTILIIEDEPSIREVISLYLKRAGFQVAEAGDGEEAIKMLESSQPELVILDLMLPNIDGFEITRYLRARGDIPIIMLTARRSEADRIAGLEMGADDYVVKPFSPQEVVSRVRAVLRRTQSQDQIAREKPLKYGPLSIQPATRVVTLEGEPKKLTAKEFDLLWFLARNPDHVFSRNQLLEHVWGLAEYIDPSTVTVHIRRLREKIEKNSTEPRYILTVWGVGYKFQP